MSIESRLQKLEQQHSTKTMYVALPIDYDTDGHYKLFEMGKADSAVIVSTDELSQWEQQHPNILLLKCVYSDDIGLHN